MKLLQTLCFRLAPAIGFVGLFVAGWVGVLLTATAVAQTPAPASTANTNITNQTSADSNAELPKMELSPLVDRFTPAITDHELDAGIARAWEYRPYRVAVWLCLDGAPELNSNLSSIIESVTRRSELIDPSGWDLQVGEAPVQFRWKFLEHLESPEKCAGFETLPMLADYDKLMVVCMNQLHGTTRIRIREFDMQTQQWGPLLNREAGNQQRLSPLIMSSIRVAFMPLGRVDRVVKKDAINEVFVQVRAIASSYRTVLNEQLQWEVVPIKNSPVLIKSDDRFLPVIRETDRDGALVKLRPIDFTFLTIEPTKDESGFGEVQCGIQSYHRAPLSGRTSGRNEKLALVIRPPQQSTMLFLHSSDKSETPLEGFDIYSRRPSALPGDENEYLGKTDWQGKLEIPPSDEGMRILLVSRGTRPLKRLPMIPGLYRTLATSIPNDETSLYAEGVLQGLEHEILNLVIERQVFEAEIDGALKEKKLSEAKTAYQGYQQLESPRDLRSRLTAEEVRLKKLTEDDRELKFIQSRFENLRSLLSKQADTARDSELQAEIQKQSGVPGA